MEGIIRTVRLTNMYLSGLLLSLAVGYSAAACRNEEVVPFRRPAVCPGGTATFQCTVTDNIPLGATRWRVNGSDCTLVHQHSELHTCSLHGSVNGQGHLLPINIHDCYISTLRVHPVTHNLVIQCIAANHEMHRIIGEVTLKVIGVGPSVGALTLHDIRDTGNSHTRNITLRWEVNYPYPEAISNFTITVDPSDPCNATQGVCVVSPHAAQLGVTVRLGHNYTFTIQGYSCDDRFAGFSNQSLQVLMQVAEAPSTCHVVPIYSVSNVGAERLKALEITWSSVKDAISINPHVDLAELQYIVKIDTERTVYSSSCKSECFLAVTFPEQCTVSGYSVSVTPKNAVGFGNSVNCTIRQQINCYNNFIRVWSNDNHTRSSGTFICEFLSGVTDEAYCQIHCVAKSSDVRIEGQSELTGKSGDTVPVTLQLPDNYARYYCNISVITTHDTQIASVQVPINFAGTEIENATVRFIYKQVLLSCTLVKGSVSRGCVFNFIMENQTEQFYISREDISQCNVTKHHPEEYNTIQAGVQWEPNGNGGITAFLILSVIEETDVNKFPCYEADKTSALPLVAIVIGIIGGILILALIALLCFVITRRILHHMEKNAYSNGVYRADC